MKKSIAILFLFAIRYNLFAVPTPSYARDTVIVKSALKESLIETSAKQLSSEHSMSVTRILSGNLRNEGVKALRDISLIAPNLYIPDYGSKMTSSIYMRGIGARIDQPAVGLYVDGIPYMNKNNYDFDFFDITGIEVYRGPQSTLYGRNTIGGVINLHTLSPMDFSGIRAEASYGSANTAGAKISIYGHPVPSFGYSVATVLDHTDGFYRNEYGDYGNGGKLCDKTDEFSSRIRLIWKITPDWTIEGSHTFDKVGQDGFPYAPYDADTRKVGAIDHNDPCTYDRLMSSEGISLKYVGNRFDFSSVTSHCHTDDRMAMDQDFSPESIFTLVQKQNEHSVSQDLVLSSKNGERKWEWLVGAFGFYKHTGTCAPVTFLKDGIDDLILANANNGIHTVFPQDSIGIKENSFVIGSRFSIPVWGAAIYHQSVLHLGSLRFTAGVRFDYERTYMRYDNGCAIHYLFTKTMQDYRLLSTVLSGKENLSYCEILPRFAVSWIMDEGAFHISASKGYKAGGFNTQIFSDILQSKMMTGMMDDLGIHIDGMDPYSYDNASATTYKPEYSWNYELGGNYDFTFRYGSLHGSATIFYIDCRDQQLTVFPPGKSTGRMMSNAGRTRSFGAEADLTYSIGGLQVRGSYGHTDARFREYLSGNDNFAGNRLPYVPLNTISLGGDYRFAMKNTLKAVVLHCDYGGLGPIWWDESNSVSQDFYSQIGASVRGDFKRFSVTLWGKNLTDADFNTFYFKSMGNSFVQKGKPVRLGITLNVTIN